MIKKMTETERAASFSHWQDESDYNRMTERYSDRKAIGNEALAKRKALDDIKAENPFYHRAAVSAEMAQMRYDMALIVEENKRLREMIETIGYLHQRMEVVYGAYSHVKMLADKSRIDYALIAKGIEDVLKLKKELTHEITARSSRPDGEES